MSQCCLLYFGTMCTINLLFSFLPLLGSLGGRIVEHQSSLPVSGSQTIYTITTERHPFFDKEQSLLYNLQSAMMIIAPIPMGLGALLAWSAYNEFPVHLLSLEDEPGVSESFGTQGAFGVNAGGSLPQYGVSGHRAQVGRAGANVARNQAPELNTIRTFEGRGQRLGE